MSVVMSQEFDLQKQYGGGKKSDVETLQNAHELCSDCKMNPIPSCLICATIKMTQEEPPFTKEDFEQHHREMKRWFCSSQSQKGMIKLTVSKNSMLIGSIDWMMNNCAFSVLVLMLSSSNAGLNSINQQTFAGYILAVIINAIQETGSCDPILLEVFRLELTILSKNPVWSNWSELVEFHKLYNICVDENIIINTDEVVFVPSNDDDGSYNVGQILNGKRGSTLVGAYNYPPSIYVVANGILSADICSKHGLRAVVLHKHDHFSIIILIDGGIFLIDGKGERIDNFKAKSKLLELTFLQFQELCAAHGAFYLFEEIPFVSERQDIPPQPAPCAQGHFPSPPPPAPFEKVSQTLPSPQEQDPLSVKFNDGILSHNVPGYSNKWTYEYKSGTVCFRAEGTFEKELLSDNKYFYNGKQYGSSVIHIKLRDACVEFLKANLPPK